MLLTEARQYECLSDSDPLKKKTSMDRCFFVAYHCPQGEYRARNDAKTPDFSGFLTRKQILKKKLKNFFTKLE